MPSMEDLLVLRVVASTGPIDFFGLWTELRCRACGLDPACDSFGTKAALYKRVAQLEGQGWIHGALAATLPPRKLLQIAPEGARLLAMVDQFCEGGPIS